MPMNHPALASPTPWQRAAWALLAAALALGVGAVLLNPPAATAEPTLNGFDLAGALVPATAIQRGGPPRDGIPAIDQPRFVEPKAARIAPDARVLGIVVNGDARAYPISILNWHEIVNDRVGGRAVVVTFCPLCGTGMAFDASLGVKPSSFGVSGLLYNSDVLLYDRETSSLWSQILMTAVTGPMKGRKLRPLPTAHTSWADWRARHPGSKLLSGDTGFARDYGRDPYAGYEQTAEPMFDVQHRDGRFPAKEWVLGVSIGEVHKAYPFSLLAKAIGSQGVLRDQVGGQALTIHFDASHRSARVTDASSAELPSLMAYWFAWVAFHPGTEVLAPR